MRRESSVRADPSRGRLWPPIECRAALAQTGRLVDGSRFFDALKLLRGVFNRDDTLMAPAHPAPVRLPLAQGAHAKPERPQPERAQPELALAS